MGIAGFVRVDQRPYRSLLFHFGFDFDFNAFCLVTRPERKFDEYGKDFLIAIPRLRLPTLSVYNETKMMELVSRLQAEGATDWCLEQDHVEFHVFSGRHERAEFEVLGTGTVAFERNLTSPDSMCLLNVELDLSRSLGGSQPYPCNATEQELEMWHSQAWSSSH